MIRYHSLPQFLREARPRLILVAPSFSDTLKKSVKYIDETYTIGLKQFTVLKTRAGETAPHFLDVKIRPPVEFKEPLMLDDHINYILDSQLRECCLEVIKRIEAIGDVTCVPRRNSIVFYRKGRRFAGIDTRRRRFDLWAKPQKGQEEWPYIEIEKKENFTPKFFGEIKRAYLEVLE